MVGRGHRISRHDNRSVTGECPHLLRRSTATATAAVVERRRCARLEARELALDRRVDVLESTPDVPSDMRAHEHGGQINEHVHVAHEVHPGGRAERAPQVTVGGEQSRVKRDQRHRVHRRRLAGGHPENGVRVVQVSLDVLQHGVPARRARNRQSAH